MASEASQGKYKRLRDDDSSDDSTRERKDKKQKKEDRRERQWQVVGSDGEDGVSSSSDDSSTSSSSSSSSDSSSDRDRKHKKHKHSKKSAKEKKSRKHKKDKKSKKEKKHKKDRKDKRDSSKKLTSINQNEFGKYGIIREEHFFQKQREFDAFMEEVKGISGVLYLPKREMMEHFKTFMEDYNTCTFPSMKYYNLEKFELQSFQQQQQQQAAVASSSVNMGLNDEAEKSREAKMKKLQQEQQEFSAQLQRMRGDSDKVTSMRRQEELYGELRAAYKRGDMATVRRLERVLAPDEDAKK
eukprot:gene29049-35063_t